jgi:glycosyltransferase involved in cell wall biosynthesis
MSKIFISVIIPVFNQSPFLDESLNSVLEQTLQNWECIIIDDFSTDDSEIIAKKWCQKDTRFSYFKNAEKGVSNARNFGISKANGIYILPLDADDKIAPTFLEKVHLKFMSNPNLSLVYSDVTFFGIKTNNYKLPKYSYKKLLTQNCFVISSVFKKSDWKKVDGYDKKLESFEDWDFWIRVLDENSTVSKIEEKLFFYRKHQKGSLSNKFATDVKFYLNLYDYIYIKNKMIYNKYFGNPILAFHENLVLKEFNDKIKNNILFKIYNFLKKKNGFSHNKK